MQESTPKAGDFPEIPATAGGWFDHDEAVSPRARALLGRAHGEWKRLRRAVDKARRWFLLTSIGLLLLSVLSAALGAAPGVSPWLRAAIATLVTAGIAFVGIFRFAYAWDVKRHAARALSFEAFAFLNQLGDYAEKTAEDAMQLLFDRVKTIRVQSESEHTGT
jgi:Protein of unknown function (DUF4231)